MGAHQRPLLPRLRKMRSEINYFAYVPIPEVRPITFIWSGQYGDGVVNRLDDCPLGTRKWKYFRTKSKCAASFEQSCHGWQKEEARRPFACNVRPGCLFGFLSARRHGLRPSGEPSAQPSSMAVHAIGFNCRRRRRAHGCDPFVVNHVPAAHMQRVDEWLAPP
jgi:hypothetical protein